MTVFGLGVAIGPAYAETINAANSAETPFISEIHYDNTGTDSGEAIEVEAPVGYDLTGWQIVLYNGGNGAAYDTQTLAGAVPEAGVAVHSYPVNGVQNGAPDGVALVRPDGTVAEFLSYEGDFTAVGGPADGQASTDLGVAETGDTPVGYSLQKIDGTWREPAAASFGVRNSTGGGTDPDPGTGCDALTVDHSIAQVQGTGAATPLAGTRVTVEGVVTADHRTGGYNGLYVQTAGSGGDRPVAAGTASDGIFVYLTSNGDLFPDAAIGDVVRVAGTASEYNGLTELTIAARSDVQVCGHDAALPAPVPLHLPLAEDARESVESMLVAPVGQVTVSDVYNTNRYGEIVLTAGDTPARVATDLARPGSAEAAAVVAANKAARILLDDARTTNLSTAGSAPPYLGADAPIRVGDTVEAFGPTVLSYGLSEWRLQPTTPVSDTTPAAGRTTFKATNPRTAAPASVGGDIRVAGFNVLNYFVHFGGDARGAADEAGLAKQEAKIVSAITALGADVVALEEIENSVRFDPDDPQQALKRLVSALNAAQGEGTWDYVRSPAELPAASAQDVITTAIIFKPARVSPVGASRSINDESVWFNAREPIAQTFHAGAIDFTVVGNHLKSKGATGATGDNVDTGDGQGAYNGDRTRQAASLAAFVDDVTADSGTDKVILLGDFNSYTAEDPLQVLYQAGYSDLNSARNTGKSSYVYGGESGSLDHALASQSLAARVTGVDIWNINAVESYAYEYDGYAPFYDPGPYRASDHDPLVVGIETGPSAPVELQLLSINDFHGRLESPTTVDGQPVGGAAQLVGLVDQLRAANPNTAFVSAGDNIGASTFISAVDGDNPTIDALNAGGLDVSAVGNHEFDKGIADLTGRVTDRADFPLLGANVYRDGQRALPAYEVQTVGGVRVGYIGVVTQQTASMVSPDGIVGVEFRDPVAEADQVAAQLSDGDTANGEADVVVLLAHEGAAAENIDSADKLAADPVFGDFTRVSADIDAVFSGHTHQPYAFEMPVPGTDRTRPVLQAEDYGVKLGRATLTYDPASGEVTASSAELLPVVGAPSNSTVADIVATAKANSAVLGQQQVGTITADITRGYTNGTENRGIESVMGNFIADVQLAGTSEPGRGGAQIALMNPGGLRADLTYGDDGVVTYAEAFSVQPFANDVVTQTLTGAQIKQVLEEQWQPDGASRPVLHLGVSEGFSYSYDPDQPRGQHIIASSITLNGVRLDPAASYRVTTNSFLAAGGDNFATLALGTDRMTTGDNDLTMLVQYFAANSPVTADPQPRSTAGRADSTAPTGSYTLDATAIWPGQAVTLTQLALSDDTSAPAAITRVVDWGDGSAPQTLPAGATTATHAYAAVGSYPVTVTLTDEAGNAAPAGFTGASTVSVANPTGIFTLDRSSIWVGQPVTLLLSAVTKVDQVGVDWGDGSRTTLPASATRASHTYARAGSFTVKVTLSNAVGSGAPKTVGTVKATKDTYAPSVRLTLPKNPSHAASWTKVSGTVTDRGLGADRVRVKLVEQRGNAWYYYTGTRWVKAGSKSSAQHKATVLTGYPDARGGWSLRISGVTRGTLTITYWAWDKAGNVSRAATVNQRILW